MRRRYVYCPPQSVLRWRDLGRPSRAECVCVAVLAEFVMPKADLVGSVPNRGLLDSKAYRPGHGERASHSAVPVSLRFSQLRSRHVAVVFREMAPSWS